MTASTNSSASRSTCCSGAGAGPARWISGRSGPLLAATALGGAALWFGWPWLIVAGPAQLLITLLPCLLMCGALCAIKMRSNKKQHGAAADVSPRVHAQNLVADSALAQWTRAPRRSLWLKAGRRLGPASGFHQQF